MYCQWNLKYLKSWKWFSKVSVFKIHLLLLQVVRYHFPFLINIFASAFPIWAHLPCYRKNSPKHTQTHKQYAKKHVQFTTQEEKLIPMIWGSINKFTPYHRCCSVADSHLFPLFHVFQRHSRWRWWLVWLCGGRGERRRRDLWRLDENGRTTWNCELSPHHSIPQTQRKSAVAFGNMVMSWPW